jgi:hypothetical protein
MTLVFAATRAFAQAGPAASPSDKAVEACMQAPSAQVPVWQQQGVTSQEVRKRLEIAFAQCRSPQTPGALAAFIAAVNTDMARAGLNFMEGNLSYEDYDALLTDRNRKLARSQNDPKFRAMLGTGDADGDLIPDALDLCPGTPDLSPTNDSGCSVRPAPCAASSGVCEASDSVQRAMGGLNVMFNKACDDAPRPSTPSPLDWGRGHQDALPAIGYNLLITRVTNQPKDCEVFYEVEFRFTDGPSGSPPVTYATAVFSDRESITNAPQSVMFPLKMQSVGPRAKLRTGLNLWLGCSWRVRAVNGSHQSSVWSGVRVQVANPKGVGL